MTKTADNNGVEIYEYKSVPTSVDPETNHSDRTQKKYTVNRTPQGGCLISRPLLFLCIAIILLLLIGAVLATYFLLATCPEREENEIGTSEDYPEQMVQARLRETPNQRLPRSLRPTHYRLKLMPFIGEGNFTAEGQVTITLNATEDTNKITLHINDITIHESTVLVSEKQDQMGQLFTVTEHKYEPEKQFYTINLDNTLKAGRIYDVDIQYTASLNDLLQGFYRISYIDYSAKLIKWMAATQFAPTDARRAFPCFDEPAMKAKFTISLAHPRNLTSRSNMRIKEVTTIPNMDDWVWDHYYETPIMSSYLVAWMVSDLQPYKYNMSNGASNRIDFAVWSRREALDQTRFAGTIGPMILEYLENYFQIPYPLPKLDLVAIPDLGFSAMENWGHVTFRESNLLYDNKIAMSDSKSNIALDISHELAHQWFGNLVTPEWWDDVWLNEGFATYLQYFGVQHVQPTWNILDEFGLNEIQTSFAVDCLRSSHPIHIPIRSIDETQQIYDSISYKKAASIIRMLNAMLGEPTFKAGLINYLNKNKYSNAKHDDLWNSLAMQARKDSALSPNVDLKAVMDTWLSQTGYPVIDVVRNYDKNSTTISQKRFLLSQNISDSTKWWIPLSYTTQSQFNFENTKPEEFFNKKEIVLKNNVGYTDWLYVNVKQVGYYRVNYDKRNWDMLITHIHELPHTVRAQLIDDSMNLARANLLEYEIPLRFVIESFRIPKYVPMAATLRNLRYIDNMLSTTPLYGKFKLFMSQLTNNVYEDLGFIEKPNDDSDSKMRRSDILEWACRFENSDCIIQARQMFRDWMIDETRKVPPNLRPVVYCTAIREGGEVEWDFAYRKYLMSNVASEKPVLLTSLGCASEAWLLSRYLHFSLSNSSGIRKQDGEMVFTSVAKNINGHRLAFEFLRTYWTELKSYYGESFSAVSGMVDSISVLMNTPSELSQLQAFKEKNLNELGTTERAFNQSIEKVRYNKNWMINSYKMIEQWLDNIIKRYRLQSYNF